MENSTYSWFGGFDIGAYDGNDTAWNFLEIQNDVENDDLTFMILYIIIAVIGILGNLQVIVVIFIAREYKINSTHWYVLQFAIAQLLFLLGLLINASGALKNVEPWQCKLNETLLFLGYYSSTCFLVVMSIDRYISSRHWRTRDAIEKRGAASNITATTIFLTIGLWTACVLLCTPVILYRTSKGIKPHCSCQYEFPRYRDVKQYCIDEMWNPGTAEFEACVNRQDNTPESYCIEELQVNLTLEDWDFVNSFGSIFETTPSPSDHSGNFDVPALSEATIVLNAGCHYIGQAHGYIVFLWINFVAMFVIPLMVMAICNGVALHRMKVAEPSRENHKEYRNNTWLCYMVLCLLILFCISWLPHYGVHLAKMRGIHQTGPFCKNLTAIVNLVACTDSLLGPLVYNLLGRRHEKSLKEVIFPLRRLA